MSLDCARRGCESDGGSESEDCRGGGYRLDHRAAPGEAARQQKAAACGLRARLGGVLLAEF